jgi:hypothetical protein
MTSYFQTPKWVLGLIGAVIGLGAAVFLARDGGPSAELTATWRFGLWALAAGVLVAEIVSRILKRR